VLALQLVDGAQGLIRSPHWPRRIRALRSHQTVTINDERELVELLRIWGPLLLNDVLPRLAPELRALLSHILQQSLQQTVVPQALRQLQPLLQMEQELTRQLSAGMVESLLELSRTAGRRLEYPDDRQIDLMQRSLDRFWEELAGTLESGPAVTRSQQLLCSLLEELKLTYLGQINRSGIDALIRELDQLTVPPVPPAEAVPATARDQSL
jgi:hypothetical protein